MEQTIVPLGRRGFRLAGYPADRPVALAGGGQANVEERAPGAPGVSRRFAPATWLARVNVHLAVASVPVLAISAHVFWLVSLRAVALFVLLPLVAALAIFIVARPDRSDRVVLAGFLWGLVACAGYDAGGSRRIGLFTSRTGPLRRPPATPFCDAFLGRAPVPRHRP